MAKELEGKLASGGEIVIWVRDDEGDWQAIPPDAVHEDDRGNLHIYVEEE